MTSTVNQTPSRPEKPAPTQATPPLFVSAHELISSQYQPKWLIKGYLEESSINLLYGPSGGGKSFLALDWACCVATGSPWQGQKVKQGKVLYIAGEGRTGLAGRLKAWQIHHKLAIPDNNLMVSQSSFNIDMAEDLINIHNALVNQTFSLIIIDTLNRNFTGDENLAKDIRNYIKGCEYLRDTFQATVLTLHHSGLTSDKRPRGSSALYAAMDSSYQLVEVDDIRGLINDKLKDGTPPKDINFKLEIVAIPDWIDEDGNPYSSCVLSKTHTELKSKTITQDTNVMLDLICNSPDFTVAKKDLRNAFYEYKTGSVNAKRSAFNRALKYWLRGGSIIEIRDEFGIDIITVKVDESKKSKQPVDSLDSNTDE